MRNNPKAFSYIDTLIGLLLTLLVVSGVWLIISLSIKSMNNLTQQTDTSTTLREVLRAEWILRSLVSQVTPPIWVSTDELVEASDTEVRFSWFQGIEENFLHIIADRNKLHVEQSSNQEVANSFSLQFVEISMRVIDPELENIPPRLSVKLKLRGDGVPPEVEWRIPIGTTSKPLLIDDML